MVSGKLQLADPRRSPYQSARTTVDDGVNFSGYTLRAKAYDY